MATYDVLAFQATKTGMATQSVIDAGNNGVLVTGIKKLAQRFVIELMTEKGSMLYRSNRGTNFVIEAKAGQLNTEIDVYSSFALALLDLRTNLTNEESDDDPLDEKYDSAEITSISILPGSVALSVKVLSKDGALANITIPLEFNLMAQGVA